MAMRGEGICKHAIAKIPRRPVKARDWLVIYHQPYSHGYRLFQNSCRIALNSRSLKTAARFSFKSESLRHSYDWKAKERHGL
jgi:hypothetical protein